MINGKFSETYLGPCQMSKMKLFKKLVTWPKPLNFFAKKLHLRCLTGCSNRLELIFAGIKRCKFWLKFSCFLNPTTFPSQQFLSKRKLYPSTVTSSTVGIIHNIYYILCTQIRDCKKPHKTSSKR